MAEKTVYIIDLDDKVTGKLKGVEKEAKKTDGAFKDLQSSLTGALSGIAFGAFAKQVFDTTAQFQSLSNSIKFASDTAGQGELSMYWLKDMANVYGLPLKELTEGFKTFQGAMMNTKFTSGEVRNMFGQVSTGVVAMGLSADDAKGVFLALGQIMGKGKVQAEELRGQIGERVPGAFNIAARAMGMSSSQLDKFMSDGKLLAEDFLPKFAAEMEKTFGQGAVDNTESLNASMNRLTNSWNELILSIGNDTEGVMYHTLNGWSILLDKIAYQFKSIEQITKESAAGGTVDAISALESQWKMEIEKMKSQGKSKDEIEKYIKSQTEGAKTNWAVKEQERQGKIKNLEETERSFMGHKVGKKDLGIEWYSSKDLATDNEEYASLLEQSQTHKNLMKEINPLTDKLISSLYMPKNSLPEKAAAKTKKYGSDGLSLNESKNGATNITFNIDTFQKNEFTKDGVGVNTKEVKDFLDQMAQGLATVLNDSQIVARQ